MDVSFVSTSTADTKLFESAVQFYKKLGLTTVFEYNHLDKNFSVQEACVGSTSKREVWLQGIADPPSTPIKDATNYEGLLVKIRLSPDGLTASEAEARVSRFHKLEHGAEPDWREIGVSFVLSVPNLQAFLDKVKSLGPEVQLYPLKASATEVYTLDPLGNVVGFTSKKNPVQLSAPTASARGEVLEGIGIEPPLVDSAKLPATSGGQPRKRIAVMTSGGDASGMNACVRAVVRTAIDRGCQAYAVYEGYEGLVQGGDLIKEMTWEDVRGLLSAGGTVIGTARCMSFRERKGRLTAAKNMITHGIDALVVCGGDGSLTGADLFRRDWPSLIKELKDTRQITAQEADKHAHLYICGTVGSIDNDMASTDATIGAYSSLDRICQMIDYIDATAQSHSRAFVIEVMGRHCGWLALMAGLAAGADYIFIPETPPPHATWSQHMAKVCKRHRERGMRKTIVIVAEGAIDDQLNPITPSMVKDVLVDLGLDTRITTLGHVQRGGNAVAFDRLLATLQGVEAVDAILESTPETPSPMIGITENKIVRRNLMEAVAATKSVADAIERKDFAKAMALRDPEFSEHLENFLAITSADHKAPKSPATKSLNIAIVTVGAPAGGMNAAIRAATAYCYTRGHVPYAIYNGWTGLARHESVRKLNWLEVEQWTIRGGCEIGTNRALPSTDFGMLAYYFQKYKFGGLIVIGGFEAFHSLYELENSRAAYPAFRIPMTCLPATVSNNVPGSEYSLGADTCLNALVEYCDVIKQSASSSRQRVFVVEVQGGNSGYVAAYAGLVTGAQVVYTAEEGVPLKQLSLDVDFLKKAFEADSGRNRAGKLVLRNEKASETFTTEIIAAILNGESNHKFEARTAIPGHVQQGGIPSPMDRSRAARLAIRCVQFIEDNQKLCEGPVAEMSASCAVVGIRAAQLVFTPVTELWKSETEVDTRKPIQVHWQNFIHVSDMLESRPRAA